MQSDWQAKKNCGIFFYGSIISNYHLPPTVERMIICVLLSKMNLLKMTSI